MSYPREPVDPASVVGAPPPTLGVRPPAGAVLTTFAEALLVGRRVALIGDSGGGLGTKLASASGRRVHVFDPDTRRAGETIARRQVGPAVAVSPLEDGLDDHVGAFDAVILPDITSLGEPEALLARVAALLSKRGVVLLATPNPDATGQGELSYYDLYDRVAAHFEHVSMFGQAPFSGFTVANFAADAEPSVTIEASLMHAAEEPLTFIAVASNAPVDVDSYVLVQVPHGPESAPESASESARASVEALQDELAELERQRSEASAGLAKAREGERRASHLASERDAQCKRLSADVSELQSRVEHDQARAHADARTARKSVDSLKRRLRQTESALAEGLSGSRVTLNDALEAQRVEIEDALQEDLDNTLERIVELEEAAEVSAAQADQARKRVKSAERRVEDARAEAATSAKSAAQNEAAARQTEAAAQQTEAAARQTEAAARRTEAAAQQNEAAAQQNEAAAQQNEAAAAQREAAALKEISALKKAALEDKGPSQRDIRAFERQITDLRKALTAARRECDVATEETKGLKEQTKRLLADATRLASNQETAPTEADARAFEFQISELRKSLDEARIDRDRAKQQAAKHQGAEKRTAALAAELEQARSDSQELRTRLTKDDSGDARGAEVTGLEAQLRERGRAFERLRRDLQESERIGRELVFRLLAVSGDGTTGNGPSETNGETRTLRAQVESLAQRCTRYEADLQAASWKLASQVVASGDDKTGDHDALETALRTAHEDLAKLKRELEDRE